MRVLITGGAGFIGNELTKQLYPTTERIVIYSRSESRQAAMKGSYPEYPDNKMRYIIGDIRDKERLKAAIVGNKITHVIHAAALKRVEVCAYDPFECIKTNVIGTMNVIEACCEAECVQKAMLISTDKAVEPITTYGKAKALAEDAFIQGNVYGQCRFSVVRYANVEGSTGSLLKIWAEQRVAEKPLTITDERMTRMWITPEKAAHFVIGCLCLMEGGEVFVPKCRGKSILQMAKEMVGPDYPIEEIGLRPAEKIHEILISESDARECYEQEDLYCIYPSFHDWRKEFARHGKKVSNEFRYCSDQA